MFHPPNPTDYTVYTKSNCMNCSKLKDFLTKEKFIYETIDCDPILLNHRSEFIDWMKSLIHKDVVFPVVFLNGIYIGGYHETIQNLIEFEDF